MKRFTETAKWTDPWFLNLSLDSKLVFWYVTENCDAAGIWDPNFRLANFCLGRDIDWDAVKAEFGKRMEVLEDGKWWLTKFVDFQYGPLSKDCKPHAKVISVLSQNGLLDRVSKGYPKGIQRDKDKEEEEEKEKEKEGGAGGQGGVAGLTETAHAIYQLYPRKVGKGSAIKAILKTLSTVSADILAAKVKSYSDATSRWPQTDLVFIPHPSTWFNDERYNDDPSTWERVVNGKSTVSHVADVDAMLKKMGR